MSKEVTAIYAKKSTDYAGKTVFKVTTPYLSKGGFGLYVVGPEPTVYVHSCSKVQLSADMEDAEYVGGSWGCAGGIKIYLHLSFAEGFLIGANLVGGSSWWDGYPKTSEYRSKPSDLPANFRDPRAKAEYLAANPNAKDYPNYKTQTDLWAAIGEVSTIPDEGSLCYFIPSVSENKFFFVNRRVWSDLLLSVECTGFQLTPAAADTPCVGGGGGGGDGEGEGGGGGGGQGDGLSDSEIQATLLAVGSTGIDLSQFGGGRIDPGNPGFGADILPSQREPSTGNPSTGAPTNTEPETSTQVDSFSGNLSESIQLPVNIGDGQSTPGSATQTYTTSQTGRLPNGASYDMQTATATQVGTDGSKTQVVVGVYRDSNGNTSQWGWSQQSVGTTSGGSSGGSSSGGNSGGP